jgi:hypothetical protein
LLPSYNIIHDLFEGALDNIVMKRPTFTVPELKEFDEEAFTQGLDIITPEFKKESPAAYALTDLYPEEPNFFKKKLGISQRTF